MINKQNDKEQYRAPTYAEREYIVNFYGNYFKNRGIFFLIISIFIAIVGVLNIATLLSTTSGHERMEFIYLELTTSMPTFLLSLFVFWFYWWYRKSDEAIKNGEYEVVDVEFINVGEQFHRKSQNSYYVSYKTIDAEDSVFNKTAIIPKSQFKIIKDAIEEHGIRSVHQKPKTQIIKLNHNKQKYGVIYY